MDDKLSSLQPSLFEQSPGNAFHNSVTGQFRDLERRARNLGGKKTAHIKTLGDDLKSFEVQLRADISLLRARFFEVEALRKEVDGLIESMGYSNAKGEENGTKSKN